jgi:hypothetical protein
MPKLLHRRRIWIQLSVRRSNIKVGAGFVNLHGNAQIFRNRSGALYSENTLEDDFRAVREALFSPQENCSLADFRKPGAIEAAAGGADTATISAKMANTLPRLMLHRAYMQAELAKVRAADEARRAGRARLRTKND